MRSYVGPKWGPTKPNVQNYKINGLESFGPRSAVGGEKIKSNIAWLTPETTDPCGNEVISPKIGQCRMNQPFTPMLRGELKGRVACRLFY